MATRHRISRRRLLSGLALSPAVSAFAAKIYAIENPAPPAGKFPPEISSEALIAAARWPSAAQGLHLFAEEPDGTGVFETFGDSARHITTHDLEITTECIVVEPGRAKDGTYRLFLHVAEPLDLIAQVTVLTSKGAFELPINLELLRPGRGRCVADVHFPGGVCSEKTGPIPEFGRTERDGTRLLESLFRL